MKNCGIDLSDEAVSYTNCGTKIEKKVNEVVLQPEYGLNHIPSNDLQKRKTPSIKISIVTATIIVFLALIGVIIGQGIALSQKQKELETYEATILQLEDTLIEYKNKGTLEKTVEAIDSWLELLK